VIARDAVNYVMKYSVSDMERLRQVHLFMWAEPYDGAAESRESAFSVQDLPEAEGRARVAEFLAAADVQSLSPDPVAAAAASDAAARLRTLISRNP
jgi:hypothetical protein